MIIFIYNFYEMFSILDKLYFTNWLLLSTIRHFFIVLKNIIIIINYLIFQKYWR